MAESPEYQRGYQAGYRAGRKTRFPEAAQPKLQPVGEPALDHLIANTTRDLAVLKATVRGMKMGAILAVPVDGLGPRMNPNDGEQHG